MAWDLNRRSVATLAVAILSIVALSMTAATLTSATEVVDNNTNDPFRNLRPAPDDGNRTSFSRTGTGNNTRNNETFRDQEKYELTRCVTFLATPVGTLLYVGGIGLLIYIVYWRYNSSTAFLGSYMILPPTLLAYFLLTDCAQAGGGGADSPIPGGFGSGGGVANSAVSPEPWMVGALFLVAVGGAFALLYTSLGEETYEPPQEAEGEDEIEMSDFAAAAGRAAERIAEHNADVDNAVYRAWVEMTGLLRVESPETYTPGEFAEAAVSVGMDREHVDELTRLFEEVRYGDKDASTREDRALEVLRVIEEEYSEEDAEAAADDEAAEGTEGEE